MRRRTLNLFEVVSLIGLFALIAIGVLLSRGPLRASSEDSAGTAAVPVAPSASPIVPDVLLAATEVATTPPDTAPGAGGIPAIPSTRAGLVPAFTAQNARAWVEAHPHPDRDLTKPGPAIEKVEFLPNKAIETLYGTTTGLPGDALLCVVTTRGSFAVGGPAGSSFTGATGYQIFDGQTGNLVLEGVAP